MTVDDLKRNIPSDYDGLKQRFLQALNQMSLQEHDISYLERQLHLFQARRFGSSSESMQHPGMQSLFPDNKEEVVSEEKPEDRPKPPRKKAKRKEFPDSLPRKEIELDVENQCSQCGEKDSLKRIGEKISEKLHVKPAEYEVHRYIRPVYSCKCCEAVITRPMPAHPIAKCLVTAPTLSHIAVGKYLDGLPLYRQERIFEREGVDIQRDLMSRWMIKVSEKLKGIHEALHQEVLSSEVVNMDETTQQVLKEKDRAATAKSFMIMQARGDPDKPKAVVFHYHSSRAAAVMNKYIDGFSGILLTDGLEVYKSVVGLKTDIVHAGCWQHVRSKFIDAQKASKPSGRKGSMATHALKLIGELFEIGRGDKNLRNRLAKPVVDELDKWLTEKLTSVSKKSHIGRAIRYTVNQWPNLVKFLEDERIPLHNNLIEQQAKAFAVARKNFLFSDSENGAHANAILFSLLTTAKLNGINPREWMSDTLRVLSENPEVDPRSLLPY